MDGVLVVLEEMDSIAMRENPTQQEHTQTLGCSSAGIEDEEDQRQRR